MNNPMALLVMGICESNGLLQNLPTAGEIKGEELSSAVELSTVLDLRCFKRPLFQLWM